MNARLHTSYVLIITALLVVIFFLFRANEKTTQENREKDSVIAEKNDVIRYRTNALGRVIAEKTAADIELKDLRKSYPMLVETINKLGIKVNRLVAAAQGGFTATGSGEVKIIHHTDTIRAEGLAPLVGGVAEINDGYLKMNGTIRTDVIDYFDYNYTYSDTLTLAFTKKKRFFRGDVITVSGSMSNPHAKFTSMTGVLVHKIKPKRFNVSVGAYYDPIRNQYGPAVTFGYSVIRF